MRRAISLFRVNYLFTMAYGTHGLFMFTFIERNE